MFSCVFVTFSYDVLSGKEFGCLNFRFLPSTYFASEGILLPSIVRLPFRRRYIRISTDASITTTNKTPPVTPPAIAAPG